MKYPKVATTLLGICLLGLPLAGAGGEARRCRAVVIGVGSYPGTSAKALSGARSDAENFAESCRGRGMQVTTLLDGEATRANILNALRSGDNSQTVLVYYSGYGSGPSEPLLMCADTKETPKGALDNSLKLEDLDKTLAALPSKERICILDTCFTAPRASKDGPTDEVVRYYRPHKSRDVMVASSYDIPGVSHDKIRYICASRYNEEALEGTVDGRQGGLFTSLLCQALKDYPSSTWQALQVQVASKLSLLAEDRQHPVFAESALASRVPGVSDQLPVSADNPTSDNDPSTTKLGGAQNWGGPPTSAWDVFAADVRDPQTVRVSVTPDKDAVKVGQPIKLEIAVGKPGYLLVINHGSEDKINTLFPLSGSLDDAMVKSGDTIQIPGPSITLSPDRPGQERVKAFLFATREKGQEFFQSMQANTGVQFKQAATKLGGRSLVFGTVAEEGRAPMNTSDLSIQVVP